MKWSVEIERIDGELEILQAVLERAGYILEGTTNEEGQPVLHLKSEKFESLNQANLIWEDVKNVRDTFKEIPPIKDLPLLSFEAACVRELSDEAKPKRYLFAEGLSNVLVCSSGYATTSIFYDSISSEAIEWHQNQRKKQELEEQKRRAITYYVPSIENSVVKTVLQLFYQEETTGTTLGHIADLIRDDLGSEMDPFLTNAQIKNKFERFGHSIQHQDVFGVKARHINMKKSSLPKKPMCIDEARQFIEDLIHRWLERKVAEIEKGRSQEN